MFLAMEWIEGSDLARRLLDRGPLSGAEALRITRELCLALHAAHEVGVIHRDVKPSNLLLAADGRVKLADFGIALPREAATIPLTLTGTSLGTPDFLPPEAFVPGFQPDARADVFAAGVTFYQALTGAIPRGRFAPPSELVRGLDPRLDAIVDRALQADPARRYPSALAMARALDEVAAASAPRRLPRGFGRAAGIAAAALLAAWIAKALVTRPPGPAAAARPPAAASPAGIDLLARVDLPRDGLAGRWSRLPDGRLKLRAGGPSESGDRGFPRIQLPYLPPAEYDFEVEFTPDAGGAGDLFQVLAVEGGAVCWRSSAGDDGTDRSGFARIDGLDFAEGREGLVTRKVAPRPGERNVSRVEVRRGLLRGFLNGELLVEWRGDTARLSVPAGFPMRNSRHPGFGVRHGDATIHRIAIIPHGAAADPEPVRFDPSHPPGTWVPAFHTRHAAASLAPGVVWDRGWITPAPGGEAALCLQPTPAPAGRDWGARATFRWNTAPHSRATVTLRKRHHRIDGQLRSEHYLFEVYSRQAAFFRSRQTPAGHHVATPLGKALPLDLRDGQEVAIEALVIDGTLYGRVNGELIEVPADGVLPDGEFDLATYDMSIRDLAFLQLDGLSPAEARQAAGLPPIPRKPSP
jgi:hypothetical protein